ncbi:MAG TPA: tetratricopeptide repeat protein [Chitinophagales bacterium]|nr:tetratricopeptide repeat protein [Chitinophagales bacterium]
MKSGVRKKSIHRSFLTALAFALVFCCSVAGYSQSATELYNQANQFYKAKQFSQAINDYEKLVEQGYKSAEVYYNLGNCYYKLDSVGKCILNYERALKLSPNDEDILHNLKLAQLKAVDNIQSVPQLAIVTWWNNFVTFNSSMGWGILALIFIWISILVFAVSFLFARRRIFNVIALLFLFVSFSSLALAFHQHQQEENSDAAIVMSYSSYIKSAPDAGASDLFMVHEGTRIQILDQVGEWNKIRLADGKVGWIEKGNFEKI